MDEPKGAVEFTCVRPTGEFRGGEDLCAAMAPALVRPIAKEKESRTLPSFFIVGPPRTGSSWLHHVLDQHTLLPGPSKETRFFDAHFHKGVKWYLAHYRYEESQGRRLGEVAPTYFASAVARERMAQLLPSARIVCVFRNPVDRIVSLYRLKRAYGFIPWSFEEAVQRDPELMETGRYASHLKLWQRSFGAANVHSCIYDDLRTDPQGFLDEVLDFIGVPRFALTAWQRGFVHGSEKMTHPRNYYGTRSATLVADWLKARRMDRIVSAFKRSPMCKLVLGGGPPFPNMSREVLRQMSEIFEPEIEELEDLLKRDLSAWKIRQSA
jgi:hypothetical protein